MSALPLLLGSWARAEPDLGPVWVSNLNPPFDLAQDMPNLFRFIVTVRPATSDPLPGCTVVFMPLGEGWPDDRTVELINARLARAETVTLGFADREDADDFLRSARLGGLCS